MSRCCVWFVMFCCLLFKPPLYGLTLAVLPIYIMSRAGGILARKIKIYLDRINGINRIYFYHEEGGRSTKYYELF